MPKFDFNPKTKRYDPKNALRLAEAAQLAYKPIRKVKSQVKKKWGFDKCIFFDKKHTQAYMIANEEIVILAFRGTEKKVIQDWLTDLNFKLVKGPFSFGRVHKGFNTALGHVWKDIRKVLKRLKTNKQSLFITGHSLGGALATLAAARFIERHVYVDGLYTFGQPRVGNKNFVHSFDLLLKKRAFRFVNNEDIVTRVPPRVAGYKHIGTVIYFDSFGKLQKGTTKWRMFLDRGKSKLIRAVDRYGQLKEQFPNGLNDHGIDQYIKGIKNNLA